MAGVLDAMGGPPPAPRPDAAMQAAGALSAPQMGPAPSQGAPQAGGGQGQAPPPTPTHGQTVAILRHMDAIQAELTALLKDPAVGKTSVKSKIIDGMTKLVANRIISPGDAVSQLGDVPDEPFKQRAWLQTHLVNAVIARVAALSHHGKAFGGTPEDQIDKTSSPDSHMADMASVQGQYGGARA